MGYPEQYRDIELNPPPSGPVLDMDCRGGNHAGCTGPPGTRCDCSCHAASEEDEPTRLEGHLNSAEYWLNQAGIYEFPNPARTECLQLAAIHASLAQAIALAESMQNRNGAL